MHWYGQCEIVDTGIDWFTTTATDRKTAALILIRAERILSQEHRGGCYIKPWRMAGYSGWRCGRLEYGVREDGAIVRLSSALADSEWWWFFETTGRCSRVDFQATIRHTDGPIRPIQKLHRSIRKFYKNRKDGPTLTEWKDSNGGYTLYVGKRQSDLYFRAYNKAAQTGDPAYENCVRLELEIKNRIPVQAIGCALSSDTVQAGIRGILSKFISERGGLPIDVPAVLPLYFVDSRRSPDVLRTLAWLRESIRPSVIALTEMGYVKDVCENLGLSNFVRGEAVDS